MNAKAFYALSYGVYIVSTWDAGSPTGCVANSAIQVTSSPATVLVSINKNNYTNKCIASCGHFALSVLHQGSDPALIGAFGFRSGKDVKKFEGVPYSVRDKLPVIDDACAYICCRVIDRMETATHTVFLGEAIGADTLQNGAPMTYAYYHSVLKGKTAKNAPTYQAEAPAAEGKWVCSVCGHVYEGDVLFEQLPESWVCPVCGQPRRVFQKQ